jgi:hypothetical protein
MVARAYILLDIADSRAKEAVGVLREKTGVVMADVLEGPPDVALVIEAPGRQQLARLAMQTLTSVETLTEHICLLPASQNSDTAALPKLFRRTITNGKPPAS